jgi:hypothetical protein
VDLSDLTRQQAQELGEKLHPHLGYLTRLTDRMQKRGWKAQDPAYRAAWNARHHLHDLVVRLHYQSAGNPGGRGGGR